MWGSVAIYVKTKIQKGEKIVLSRDKQIELEQMGRKYRVAILGSICLSLLAVTVVQGWNRQPFKVVRSLPPEGVQAKAE